VRWGALFSGDGRIDRRGYWAILSGLIIVGVFVGWGAAAPAATPWRPLLALVALVCATVCVCTNTKRLHDFGRSGRWQFAPLGVGVAVALLALTMQTNDPASKIGVLEALLFMFGAFHAALGLVPGDAHPNRFDAAPQTTPA
jgi:uncharacterized membrane protein YhaH (DUF805 family)